MKTASVLESKKDFKGAIDIYKQVRKDYPMSSEAREIEKYIGRAEALSGSN
jgi:hypothetical protein